MKKILVSLILFISVFLITKDMVFMLLLNSSNDKMVKAYFNNNSSFNYNGDMVLDIPDISLKNIVKKSDDKTRVILNIYINLFNITYIWDYNNFEKISPLCSHNENYDLYFGN